MRTAARTGVRAGLAGPGGLLIQSLRALAGGLPRTLVGLVVGRVLERYLAHGDHPAQVSTGEPPPSAPSGIVDALLPLWIALVRQRGGNRADTPGRAGDDPNGDALFEPARHAVGQAVRATASD
ncbi:MAG: hypothetical protein ACLQDY_22420 [Streptosporangiaceae bacterium]